MQDTDELEPMLDEPDEPRWEADSGTRREGVRRGLARQRGLLARLATQRFGTQTAVLFEDLLDGINDPGRLASFGKWVIDTRTADEPAPADTAEFAPTRLEEIIQNQLRETYANGLPRA